MLCITVILYPMDCCAGVPRMSADGPSVGMAMHGLNLSLTIRAPLTRYIW